MRPLSKLRILRKAISLKKTNRRGGGFESMESQDETEPEIQTRDRNLRRKYSP